MGASPEIDSAKTRFAGDVMANIGSKGSFDASPRYLAQGSAYKPPEYKDPNQEDNSTDTSTPAKKQTATVIR